LVFIAVTGFEPVFEP